METRLYRKESWYRPLFVDIKDKHYHLGDIRVYDENGIIAKVGRGFFDNDNELTIKGEIFRRLKENFTKKENFVIKAQRDLTFNDDEYLLYIYVGNIDFQDYGEIKKYDCIYHKYSINGLEFEVYVKDLSKKIHEFNDLAKIEVEKLNSIFGYGGKGIDENSLSQIFSNLKDLNNKILKEVKRIDNYKI